MRRKVHLSSLSVGRCFTIPSDDADGGTADGEEKATLARAVMTTDNVWKVTAAGETMSAQNAEGTTKDFPGTTLVAEIPRQGYDRMVERAG